MDGLLKKSRQRPTLPPGDPGSTIGAGGLNCSVRNGKRCFPSAKATGKSDIQMFPTRWSRRSVGLLDPRSNLRMEFAKQNSQKIAHHGVAKRLTKTAKQFEYGFTRESTARVDCVCHIQERKKGKPHGQLVSLGYTRYRASTCDLSTS